MLEMPLRIGISGSGSVSRGVEFQINQTDGMELGWRCEADDVEEHLKNEPVEVFVEACGHVGDAGECSLLAIENNAHVVLTDARVDVTFGLALQSEAQQRGIIVTSDAGTPHGALASMIQEAHIMGFKTVQAGQISPCGGDSQFLYEMAALANGFGFLPPPGGMTGPEVTSLKDALTAFDLESYEDTPRVDFLRLPEREGGLYLIVKPKTDLPAEQLAHLRNCHLGAGPYYLLRRDYHLGHLETSKAILGAAAGQPILSPGQPSCQIYASSRKELPAGTSITGDLLEARLEPVSEALIPLILLEQGACLIRSLARDTLLNSEDAELQGADWLQG